MSASARKFCLIVAFFASLTIPSGTASADEGKVWAGAAGANLSDLNTGLWGGGGFVGAQWAFSDFWALFGDYALTYHFADDENELPADLVNALGVGLRYNLDVFTYVPYIGLGATFYLDAPLVSDASLQANAGGKLVLGVDWRMDRFWSVGFSGEIHALVSDLGRYPVYSFFGISLGYHFRL